MQVKFEEWVADDAIQFAVIAARYHGQWVICRHEERSTWEIPGGHREPGETLLQTAKRELYEETGAAEAVFREIGIYSVQGKTPYQEEDHISYGMLFAADIRVLGPKPQSEIKEVVCTSQLPENLAEWTYPEIQPLLVQKVMEGMVMQGSRYMIDDVPFISQLIRYPTGCESVSAVMALNYLGSPITPEEFMDNLLPRGAAPAKGEDGIYYGCDPWKAFPGTPYTNEGWGCFAPVIVEAVNRMEGFRAEAYYDLSIKELLTRFIDRDIPVLFWATINMETPRNDMNWVTEEGKAIRWINPMHCLLLIGYDEDGYYFNDPTGGERAYYTKDQVQTAYDAQGRQAVIISRLMA